MGAKTFNNSIEKLAEGIANKEVKFKTTVPIELRDTENSIAILLSKEQSIELAHMLINGNMLFEKDRIVLTIKKNSQCSMSVTSY
ncbi:TPA: hypothetical protein ACGW8F_005289 [Bacillus cereus]|uniref:hypothetical protein n=1 Tax=Bacillus cereus group TaxID=86661 RepID=UPI0002411FD8|nr:MULTISPECIES: hypothetical protein [Bacillus cereus group]ASJ51920.1 hypothetical protein BA204_28135 [Bacillus cereus]EHL65850.1 hypothetical protein HMPREF1014_05430 [Bacillus sp. 7_6_55CFAA_CT2]PGN30853.1 hypothetical protein CN960_28955 [Bacillus cereus]TKI94821.1 hypothetical protein FC702_31560 [Bacillus cereus]